MADSQAPKKTSPAPAKQPQRLLLLKRLAPFLALGILALVLGPLLLNAIAATLSSGQIADSIDISNLYRGSAPLAAPPAPNRAIESGLEPAQGIAAPGNITNQRPTDFHQRQLNVVLTDFDRIAQAHEDALTHQRAYAWKLFALQKCQQMNLRQAGSCKGPMDYLVMRLESETNRLRAHGQVIAPTADGEAIVYKTRRDAESADEIRDSKATIKEITLALATPGEPLPADQIDISHLVEVTSQILSQAHLYRSSH